MEDHSGWEKLSHHVISELKRLNDGQKEIVKAQQKTNIEIATLKAKSSIWGAISGAVFSVIVAIVIRLYG